MQKNSFKYADRNAEDLLSLAENHYERNNYDISHMIMIFMKEAYQLNKSLVVNYCNQQLALNPNHLLALIARANFSYDEGYYVNACEDYEVATVLLKIKKSPFYSHYMNELKTVKETIEKQSSKSSPYQSSKATGYKRNKRQPVSASFYQGVPKTVSTMTTTSTSSNDELLSFYGTENNINVNDERLLSLPNSPAKKIKNLNSTATIIDTLLSQDITKIPPNHKTSVKELNSDESNMIELTPVVISSLNQLIAIDDSPIEELKISSFANSKPSKIAKLNTSKSKLTSKERVDLGKQGESIVFEKLKKIYKKEYNDPIYYQNFKESSYENIIFEDEDIKLVDAVYRINCDSQIQGHLMIEIIWHNKENESGKPNDLTIIKLHGEKLEHKEKIVIEVKSTKSLSEKRAEFSENEIKKMQKFKEHYRLCRVYGIGNNNLFPVIKWASNPYEKIFPAASVENGNKYSELSISGISLRI